MDYIKRYGFTGHRAQIKRTFWSDAYGKKGP